MTSTRQVLRDMDCAVGDSSRQTLMYQGTHPLGREYQGKFYQALRCPCCAYLRFPDPSPDVLDEFYSEEYPAVSADWYNPDTDYSPAKTDERSRRVIELLKAFGLSEGSNVHEFGCAFGGTVHAMNQKGYRASGTELNEGAVAQGRARGNEEIHPESAIDFLGRQAEPANAVYSYHALEHFTDPFAFLRELREVMDPNGLIISFLPNSAALFPIVYGHIHYVWFGYPEHLHLFSPGSANALAKAAGFELLHISTAPIDIGQSGPISRALHRDAVSSQYLRNEPMDRYGEELIVVMTPAGSNLLQTHAQAHLNAQEYSRSQGIRERFLMDQLNTHSINPWVE